MASTNAEVVRRVFDEIWNKGNLSLVKDLVDGDFVDHNPLPGAPTDGKDYKQAVSSFRAAFPDVHFTLDQVLSEGDEVAYRLTVRGSHKGTFAGIAPSARQATFGGMGFIRVKNGKIAERWGIYDLASLMQQITRTTETTVEENKNLIIRYFDTIWNHGQFDAEPDFVAMDIVVHQAPIPGIPPGIGGPLAIVGTFRASMPDIHIEHIHLFGEGDKVVHRWVGTGTHSGEPLFGVPSSGKTLTLTGINTFRIEKGRIAERWGHMDAYGLLRQLGVIPSQ